MFLWERAFFLKFEPVSKKINAETAVIKPKKKVRKKQKMLSLKIPKDSQIANEIKLIMRILANFLEVRYP